MKRINILLSKGNLFAYLFGFLLFAAGLPLFIQLLCTMLGEASDAISFQYILLFGASGLLLILYLVFPFPLYLEYNDEVIVAHCLFRKPVTVRKDKPIYRSYCTYARSGYYVVLSNEPFEVHKDSSGKQVTSHIRFGTQIILQEQIFIDHPDFCKRSACTPAEQIDWSKLSDSCPPQSSFPCKHQTYFTVPELLLYPFCTIVLASMLVLFLFVIFDTVALGLAYFLVALVVSLFPLAAVIWGFIILCKYLRFCGISITFTETTVTSKRFKKELCIVDLTQPVHYAVFHSADHTLSTKPYIVISNKYFNPHNINKRNSTLSNHDTTTQIAFRYNAETAAYCDFDNWHRVGGFSELNIKRSKN